MSVSRYSGRENSEFLLSEYCILVWIRECPVGAHSSTQEQPVGSGGLFTGKAQLWHLDVCNWGAGQSHTYYCGSHAPLEVEVLGSAVLQVGQQDYGWSGCRIAGSGLSGWWY